MKIGDKVGRQVRGGDYDFFRIRAIKGDRFETDPNSPFERSWVGKVNEYRPYEGAVGYWVPLPPGTKPKPFEALHRAPDALKKNRPYELTVNWKGEVHTTKTQGASIEQALLIGCVKLARTTLNHVAAWSIQSYCRQHPTRYTLKALDEH